MDFLFKPILNLKDKKHQNKIPISECFNFLENADSSSEKANFLL